MPMPTARVSTAAPAPLIVVAIDRLPAWIMSAYGASWVGQPEIAGLAARGIVFDRVIATSDDPRSTLADILAPLGGLEPATVVTDAETGPPGVSVEADIRRVPVRADGRLATDPALTNLGRLFATAEATIRQLRTGEGEGSVSGRRLVVVEATSLGVAWDAPEEFREAYQAPDDPPPPPGGRVPSFVADAETDPDVLVGIRHVFAGQLTLLDGALGRLLAVAGADATVLLCGLRGLGLGLHGRVGPGPMPPYGELVHLPAILVDASGRMAGQRYDGLATPADLGATLADLVGIVPSGGRGQSLAGLYDGWRAPNRDRVIVRGEAGAAVVTSGWHAVLPADATSAMPRLYAKPDDFFELCDVADRSPDVAGELGRLMEAAVNGRTTDAWHAPLSHAAAAGVT
jgi:hypothetical protein